jgi:hypothetical protein
LIPEHLGAGGRGQREKEGGRGGAEPPVAKEHVTPREKWDRNVRADARRATNDKVLWRASERKRNLRECRDALQ